MSDFFNDDPEEPRRPVPIRHESQAPAAAGADARRDGGAADRLLALRRHLDRQAVVQQRRLRQRVQQAALDPGRAVPRLRPADGASSSASTSASPTGCGRCSAPHSPEQANLDRYREVITPIRRLLADRGQRHLRRCSPAGPASGKWRIVPAVAATGRASARPTRTSTRTSASTSSRCRGCTILVDFAMTALVIGLLAAAVVHYLYGGIRLQARTGKVSGAGAGAALRAARRAPCCSRPSTTGSTGST